MPNAGKYKGKVWEYKAEEVGQAISELSRELSTNQIAPFSHCVLK